jgi:hypothetical protein
MGEQMMKTAVAMGLVVLTGMAASPAFARLGETRAQVLARYGTPTETVKLGLGLATVKPGSEIESIHFKKGALTIFVEISPTTGKAIQIYYWKDTPFAPAQVAELLSRNSEGKLWDQSPYYALSARRSDGGLARGQDQKNPDGTVRYMFAVLSKSAGGGLDKSPADEVGENAAKEIEGL